MKCKHNLEIWNLYFTIVNTKLIFETKHIIKYSSVIMR